MPKLSQLEKLMTALRRVAEEADPRLPSFQIADRFYKTHRDLIDKELIDEWIIDRIAHMLGRYRAKVRQEHDPQLSLEFSLGFKSLPPKIEVKPGVKVPREEATLGAFRRLVTRLSVKDSPRLIEAKKAVELMEKYAKRGNEDLTWGEALKLEAKAAKART